MVSAGLMSSCSLAGCPIITRSPANATTLGNRLPPFSVGMTRGAPPSVHAASVLVVPRSMPICRGLSPVVAMRRQPTTSPCTAGAALLDVDGGPRERRRVEQQPELRGRRADAGRAGAVAPSLGGGGDHHGSRPARGRFHRGGWAPRHL